MQRQIRTTLITAPGTLRGQLRALDGQTLIDACGALAGCPTNADDTAGIARVALRSLARRHRTLSAEIADLQEEIDNLTPAEYDAIR